MVGYDINFTVLKLWCFDVFIAHVNVSKRNFSNILVEMIDILIDSQKYFCILRGALCLKTRLYLKDVFHEMFSCISTLVRISLPCSIVLGHQTRNHTFFFLPCWF